MNVSRCISAVGGYSGGFHEASRSKVTSVGELGEDHDDGEEGRGGLGLFLVARGCFSLLTALAMPSLAFALEIRVGRVTAVFLAGEMGFLRGGILTERNLTRRGLEMSAVY
jgi:hypothetical protein